MVTVRRYLREAASWPWPALWLSSLTGFAVLALAARILALPDVCGSAVSILSSTEGARALSLIMLTNPIGAVLQDWFLMLIAMMSPLLRDPIAFVWHRSLPYRRVQGILMFLFGYVAVWMLAAGPLLAAGIALRMTFGQWAIYIAVTVALLWRHTRWYRVSLGRCHLVRRINAFGIAADVSCLKYGLSNGRWCLAACWAWMLVPIVVSPRFHIVAMFMVSAFLIRERLHSPHPAQWRIPPVCNRFWMAMSIFHHQ